MPLEPSILLYGFAADLREARKGAFPVRVHRGELRLGTLLTHAAGDDRIWHPLELEVTGILLFGRFPSDRMDESYTGRIGVAGDWDQLLRVGNGESIWLAATGSEG